MTRIYACLEGGYCTLEAKGHATGASDVCAGVSAILYTLAGYLRNHDVDATVKLEPGDAFIEFEEDSATHTAFEMAVIGLVQIADSYPDNLRIIVRGIFADM